MLIVNGYIVSVNDNGGFDDDGNPIVENIDKNQKIPCNYVRISYDGKGYYEDGKFYKASYTILTEERIIPQRIQLFDDLGNFLGEYNIKRNAIVYLSAVGLTQITA